MMTTLPLKPRTHATGKLRFPGAFLLLFPLLTLGMAIAWLQNRPAQRAGYPDAPGRALDSKTTTWTGDFEQPGGARVSVHLRRLHNDAVQQEFETQTLRKRFERAAGEPWLLVLSATPNWSGEIDLAGLSVVSAGLEALQPLAPASDVDSVAVFDPVRVLFSAAGGLRPGATRRLVLWGTQPADAAQFVLPQFTVKLQVQELPLVEGPLILRTARDSAPAEGGQLAAEGVK